MECRLDGSARSTELSRRTVPLHSLLPSPCRSAALRGGPYPRGRHTACHRSPPLLNTQHDEDTAATRGLQPATFWRNRNATVGPSKNLRLTLFVEVIVERMKVAKRARKATTFRGLRAGRHSHMPLARGWNIQFRALQGALPNNAKGCTSLVAWYTHRHSDTQTHTSTRAHTLFQ